MPFIDLTLIEGCSPEMLREFIRRVTVAPEETLNAPGNTIRVVLREVPASNWAVGGEPKR